MEYQAVRRETRYLKELNGIVNTLLAQGWKIRNEFTVPGTYPELVVTLEREK